MNGAVRLGPWEESCGRLRSIVEDTPYITLDFGIFKVRLGPTEAAAISGQLTEELIGKRISILKTDIPDKLVLLRILTENSGGMDESLSELDIAIHPSDFIGEVSN